MNVTHMMIGETTARPAAAGDTCDTCRQHDYIEPARWVLPSLFGTIRLCERHASLAQRICVEAERIRPGTTAAFYITALDLEDT